MARVCAEWRGKPGQGEGRRRGRKGAARGAGQATATVEWPPAAPGTHPPPPTRQPDGWGEGVAHCMQQRQLVAPHPAPLCLPGPPRSRPRPPPRLLCSPESRSDAPPPPAGHCVTIFTALRGQRGGEVAEVGG
ncbi:hypothetical protein E2C01_083235 [Portunus trituberculatus]|uniref:Uncharacterized protein n=1 Tax=Portunus trituberculatus TaxID=210409 RepID=A0A5B7J1F3_PORTR|nr:hypothetical protein [Portunus trituberculatus]